MRQTTKKKLYKERLAYWTEVYEKYQAAYLALIEGGVKYYMIDDRQLSRFEITDVQRMLREAEEMIDKYSSLLDGDGARAIRAVVPKG